MKTESRIYKKKVAKKKAKTKQLMKRYRVIHGKA